MSAVAAVLRRDLLRESLPASDDRAPELEAELLRVLGAMTHRGIDGTATLYDEALALGHHHFWTTPEARGERQPLTSGDGAWWLVVDGRLDNRDELWQALDGTSGPLRSLSDAALMLAAFERWGRACLPRFLGPFALIAWDRRRRELTLARDVMGGRGLSFHLSESLLVAASEEQAVAAHSAVDDALDPVRTALFFALEPLTTSRTFFSGVCHLAPGEALTVGPREAERWWFDQLSPAKHPPGSPEAWEERFREALAAAVTCRLRGGEPPAALVSGGLDSSPMAALAAEALGTGRPLRAISWVFDQHPACDEREYLGELYDALPLEPVHVRCDDAWPLSDPASWPVHPATPEQNPYRRFHERAYRAAGSRVLLLGIGGDQLYAGVDRFLLELLAGGRWRHAAREGLWHLRAGRRYRRWMLRGLVPGGIRRTISHRRGRPWLTPAADAWRQAGTDRPIAAGSARRPKQWISLVDPMNGHGCSLEAYHGSQHSLELRYPFRDRRLTEVMLQVPTAELYSQGVDRRLLRRAMIGRVPEKVLERRSKASFEPILRRGLFREAAGFVGELLDGPRRRWPEWVDPAFLATARRGETASELEVLILWQCISLELWFSRVSRGGAVRERREIAGLPSGTRVASNPAAVWQGTAAGHRVPLHGGVR
ncbi:MAG: hypothetical protein KDD11_21675 [Acidobacteria bacterium]|nr:hypothetical protein [Acidobacteriota bacterium]